MIRDEFNAVYKPRTKCLGTYRRDNGDRVKGLIVDGPATSLAGIAIVVINSVGRSIRLDTLETVKDIGIPLGRRPPTGALT